jgi:cyanamide hydratase
MPKQQVEEFGWTAVPRNRSNIPSAKDADTHAVSVVSADIWPNTEVVKKARDHAKKELSKETYNHSLRVYCYGTSTRPLMLQKKKGHKRRRRHLQQFFASN